MVNTINDRSVALTHCLGKLPDDQRQLVKLRYAETEAPLQQVAETVGKTVPAVTMALSRIRRVLLECIRHELAKEGAND